MGVLKTREGFFAFIGIVVQAAKLFAPKEAFHAIDVATELCVPIVASRLFKKQVTPGLTPFVPAPGGTKETVDQ
jgi:hypothetical protein